MRRLFLVDQHDAGRGSLMAAGYGFLVPRARGTSRPAGWVHQSAAPASASGRISATTGQRRDQGHHPPAGGLSRTGYTRSSRIVRTVPSHRPGRHAAG